MAKSPIQITDAQRKLAEEWEKEQKEKERL